MEQSSTAALESIGWCGTREDRTPSRRLPMETLENSGPIATEVLSQLGLYQILFNDNSSPWHPIWSIFEERPKSRMAQLYVRLKT
jgi:hypothetical protein